MYCLINLSLGRDLSLRLTMLLVQPSSAVYERSEDDNLDKLFSILNRNLALVHVYSIERRVANEFILVYLY